MSRLRRRLRPYYNGVASFGIGGLQRVSPWLGHAGNLRLGRLFGHAWYTLYWKHRRTALENIRRIGLGGATPRSRRRLARRSFVTAGSTVFEAVHATGWSPDYVRSIVTVEGESNWSDALARGKGVVCVSAHYGGWPLVALHLRYERDVPTAMIIRGGHHLRGVDPLRRMRERHGVQHYELRAGTLGYLRTLTGGGAVVLLADLYPNKRRSVESEFLGRSIPSLSGYAEVARLTGAAVLPVLTWRTDEDSRRHVIGFREPVFPDTSLEEGEDVRRMVRHANRCFEEQIRRRPDQWLWMRDRWRFETARAADRRRPLPSASSALR